MGDVRVSEEKRYTVAVDFDGVLHRYDSQWINAHTIPDGPVPGAIEWLHRMIQKFDIVIHSTRCKTWRGRSAMRAWLKEHAGNLYYEGPGHIGIESVNFAYKKVPALISVDDRAWRFTGANWPTSEDVHRARPWNKESNRGY